LGRKKALKETEEIIRRYADKLVLDMGCGTGRYSYLFDGNLVGFDLSFNYLRKAKDKNHYVQGNSSFLPFKGDTFNTILSVGLFHHLDDTDALKTIDELVRCAKQKSKIILLDPLLPKKKYDIIGYIFVWLDRGSYFRGLEKFKKTLGYNTSIKIIKSGHISRSYPYNLHYFVITV
jgi:SAM-dependent methyltransferase